MKKRILPFIVAMSVVLPIQSFAAESVEASAQEGNVGQWKVVWQSSNTIVKYNVVKWKPTKYSNAFVKKEQAVVPTTETPKVQPEPKQEVVVAEPETKQEAKPVTPTETKQEAKPATPTETKQEAKPATSTETKQEVAPATPQKQTETAADTSILSVEQEVVRLVNVERAKEGLQPLVMDNALQKVAKKKSEDMKANNYFSHTSPTYGSPFDMMKSFGVTYKSAGENIAKGQTSAKQVVDAWMNSAGHRANIMSTSFTHIGVGYVESGHYWTQMFIKK